MIFRDKYGWQVVRLKGKHVTNFIRILILTDVVKTIAYCVKRKEPCEYCKNTGLPNYNNCPNCGRKLKENE